ncbi:uncharacterized protein TNCV_2275511 [Trichonephila clavipes]|nr:uncharacterized protein TNCV_2275511 [Trichonephila clavipes]
MTNDESGARMEMCQFFRLIQVCLQHQDGRIRVRWHRGHTTLVVCIRHRHIGPLPGMMVWGNIGYTSRSLLVRIDDTFNSARYISGVLRPVTLPFIRVQ